MRAQGFSTFGALGLAAALSLGVAGCATRPAPAPPTATPAPAPAPQGPSLAIELLLRGRPQEARETLVAVLAAQPSDLVAVKLLGQIDKDPKVLLGDKAYPYRVRPGETLSALAERFLGDPLMFYALARYNQIDPPSQPLAGRTIMIPGTAKPAPKRARRAPAPRPASAAAALRRDQARAAELRSAGLAQMNQGAISLAVELLQQARDLDPANAAIQRDLSRAVRIQRTIQGR